MRRCETDFTVRNGLVNLSPRLVGAELSYAAVVRGEALADAWRIVEVWSELALPFAVRLRWTAGRSAGDEAWVTVSRATRICVCASAVQVDAANLASLDNRVKAALVDGFLPTHNQWEQSGAAQNGVAQDIPLPPFADRARLELSDPTLLPTTVLQVYNGFNLVAGATQADAQPDAGIPVGGARRLELTVTGGAPQFRIVFTLRL